MPDLKPVSNHTRTQRYYLAASQTIDVGDPVLLNSAGYVELATAASATLLGICAEKITASTVGQAVVVFDDPDLEFEILADEVAEAIQTAVGETHDLIVTSGAFLANLGATTTNVIKVLAVNTNFDPLLDGETIYGSSLAGNFVPPWNDKKKIRCKFAIHQKAN